MLTVFFRSLIVFVTILIVVRFMGKRQIGEMQPFELVITLIIADLACIPMSDVSIPLVYGLVAIVCIFLVHRLITIFNRKSLKMRAFFSGKPVIVINPDGIDFEQLNSLNMTISDLEEAIRVEGYFSFDELQYAIFETNGRLSVIAKSKDEPQPTFPITLVSSGKFDIDGLKLIGENELFVLDVLKKEGIKSVKNILIFTIDNDGKIYYQEKFKKYVSKTIDFSGGDNW